MWDRFVNSRGGAGHNIPCDLHNEHVNKIFKGIIGNMGATFTEQATTVAARAVSALATITESFDKQTGIGPDTSAHCLKPDEDDVKQVVRVIKSNSLLSVIPQRHHTNFPKIALNPLGSLNWSKLSKWMSDKIVENKKFRRIAEGNASDSGASDDEC